MITKMTRDQKILSELFETLPELEEIIKSGVKETLTGISYRVI